MRGTILLVGAGADLVGGCRGCESPPPRDDLRFSNTTGMLQKKKTMWFIGVEVEQETSAPPPKKILDPPLGSYTKEAPMPKWCIKMDLATEPPPDAKRSQDCCTVSKDFKYRP